MVLGESGFHLDHYAMRSGQKKCVTIISKRRTKQMKEIIEYRVIVGKNLDDLQQTVNGVIKDGWQPYGNLQTPSSIMWTAFTQVVVKCK